MTTTESTTGVAQRSSAALLQLMWLASPTLPIGGFSYSEGLEAAVDHGVVHDEPSATHWLVDQLHLGLGRGELVVVAQAIAAWRSLDWTRLQALNDWVHQTRESDELRQQTVQMGSSLMSWRKSLREPIVAWDAGTMGAVTYPVAFGSALAATEASIAEGLLAYAFGWAENMSQAAIKSVPLGQSAGQRIVMRLQQAIPEVVEAALQRSDEDRQAFTPMLALLSAQHEMQYSRLFRS
jgi:urease accessory protein